MRLVRRGYGEDAIKWVVTRGYSSGTAAPVAPAGRVGSVTAGADVRVTVGRSIRVSPGSGIRIRGG